LAKVGQLDRDQPRGSPWYLELCSDNVGFGSFAVCCEGVGDEPHSPIRGQTVRFQLDFAGSRLAQAKLEVVRKADVATASDDLVFLQPLHRLASELPTACATNLTFGDRNEASITDLTPVGHGASVNRLNTFKEPGAEWLPEPEQPRLGTPVELSRCDPVRFAAQPDDSPAGEAP